MEKFYRWPSSSLKEEEMKGLFAIREKTHKPITILVKEAVREYISKQEGGNGTKKTNR